MALRRILPLLLALLCLPLQAQQGQVAHNPLTYTDIPDNDVIRVGEDYYMVSTTMYFCPGAPIMHSRDLVHWRLVAYVYDLLEDDDVYNLRNGRNAYGKGQWATSLRYHDGVYYALFVANDQKKSYLYRTRDIVNGPWERTVFDDWFFHDPSMLFDQGRLWVVWGNGELKLAELALDGSSVISSEPEVIVRAPREGWGLRAEGAHFYRIGDYYYIIEIDWPKDDIRQVTCWRSRDIHGPYESRVVLHGTLDGRSKDGIAQGPIVDTPTGDWYAIQFQDHGAVGRIPTIQPVTWEDGWPVMGDGGRPLQDVTVNLPADGRDYVWASDEFENDHLPLVWQWNHKPPTDWSLSARPGWLRLQAHPSEKGIATAVGTLTQRTAGPRCISEVLLDASALAPGDQAGICAFQSHGARIGVEVDRRGNRRVVLREREKRKWQAPFQGESIYLRIRYVFTPQDDGEVEDTAFFSWSADGKNWTEVPYCLKMRYTLDYFTGYRSALYCFGTGGGHADFDYFHQHIH